MVARIDQQDQLRNQLQVGDSCQGDNEKQALLQLLCTRHQVFTLSDAELGKTDLVEHQIELVSRQPLAGFLMHSEHNWSRS